ncbi:MAG: DUF3021 domain-containing protein [Solobacterium sp.]|nr:DUF3021 domain-containing protein [Solobacterium sp.]
MKVMAAGNLIAVLFSYLPGGDNRIVSELLSEKSGSEGKAFLIQTLLSGFPGAVGMGGTAINELENRNLLRCTLAHFSLIFVVYVMIALYLGWITFSLADIAGVAYFMGIAYLIVFLIMLARYRKAVHELNEILKKNRNSQ